MTHRLHSEVYAGSKMLWHLPEVILNSTASFGSKLTSEKRCLFFLLLPVSYLLSISF